MRTTGNTVIKCMGFSAFPCAVSEDLTLYSSVMLGYMLERAQELVNWMTVIR